MFKQISVLIALLPVALTLSTIWSTHSSLFEIKPYVDVERLVYADDCMLVYDKPPNVSSVPGLHEKDSLAGLVAKTWNIDRIDQMIVHRLDYATSGLIVFARHVSVLKALHEQFRQKRVKKNYKAIVCRGNFHPSSRSQAVDGTGAHTMPALEGEISLPILRDAQRGPPFHCAKDVEGVGKPSLTIWRVHAVRSGQMPLEMTDMDQTGPRPYEDEPTTYVDHTLALLSMEPHTGRTHQLRIHAADCGMPICGDPFYAPLPVTALAPRLLLHAESLVLTHPVTGKPMSFHAQAPFRLRNA